MHTLDIMKAENTFNTLLYSVEKKPHVRWDKFNQQMTSDFTIFDHWEVHVVHSDKMKLRMILNKIQSDFIFHVKASIGIELTRHLITLSYEKVLATFRNEVHKMFPTQISSVNCTRQSINKMDTHEQGREVDLKGADVLNMAVEEYITDAWEVE